MCVFMQEAREQIAQDLVVEESGRTDGLFAPSLRLMSKSELRPTWLASSVPTKLKINSWIP